MIYLRYILFSTLLLSTLLAYVDEDIDGVDDSIDQCLNTPFDQLADEHGCSKGQRDKKKSRFTIKVGTNISFNEISDTSTNINFYEDYRYQNWDISLSTSNYTNYINSTDNSSDTGDIYLSVGYLFKKRNFNTKLTVGMKFAVADDDVGTGEDDYYSSIYFDYYINMKQDIFLYYSYTISGDSPLVDYENFSSISVGTGYAVTYKWYSGLSYDYSGSNYKYIDDYRALTWFNSYYFTKKYFTTFSYSYGLDDLSYDHTLSLKFGVNF